MTKPLSTHWLKRPRLQTQLKAQSAFFEKRPPRKRDRFFLRLLREACVLLFKKNRRRPGGFEGYAGEGKRLDLLDDCVGQTVFDRFLGGHIEIPVGVFLDLLQRLA